MAISHKKVGDPWHELTSTILSLFYHRFARNLVRYIGIPVSCSSIMADFLNDVLLRVYREAPYFFIYGSHRVVLATKYTRLTLSNTT